MIIISKLYERSLYTNTAIPYLINNEIIEYDIRSAGFNLMKQYKLADESVIEKLQLLDKKARQIQIGLLRKRDKEFSMRLNDAFVDIRRAFFEANEVQDDDILSIKNDAIFSLKRFRNLTIGRVEFVEKNTFSSYYYINKIEFYHGSHRDLLEVKGIHADVLELHMDHMLNVLRHVFRGFETNAPAKVIRDMKTFAIEYKRRNLAIEYYRELSRDSYYRIEQKYGCGKYIAIEELGNDYIDKLDIGYNYIRYIIPLVSIMV